MIVKSDTPRRAAGRRNAPAPHRRSRLLRRPRQRTLRVSRHNPAAEADFWARCAEYDDGRLAQEADHLFDTSYPWAF
jgi:hypothetical protein